MSLLDSVTAKSVLRRDLQQRQQRLAEMRLHTELDRLQTKGVDLAVRLRVSPSDLPLAIRTVQTSQPVALTHHVTPALHREVLPLSWWRRVLRWLV